MNSKLLQFLALTALALTATTANAYVSYNRLGYVSCAACHFVGTGGGILTPYGQSVQAAMGAISKEVNADEKPVSFGVQARAIVFDHTRGANPFLMQTDFLADVAIGKISEKEIRGDFIVGPNLKQAASSFISIPSGWDALILRRAIFSSAVSDTGSVSVGRDAAVAGLNIDDHTAFLRSTNKRGENDYPTQLRYTYQTDSVQVMPYLALPSFEESSVNQEYSVGARGEYLLDSTNSVGLTTLYGSATGFNRVSFGGFVRLSRDHWNGFMGEFTYTHYGVSTTSGSGFGQRNVYLRPYVAIPEWIETSFVWENLNRGSPVDTSTNQYGPEVNVRINRYWSLIGDGRNVSSGKSSSWSWYGQAFVHVQI